MMHRLANFKFKHYGKSSGLCPVVQCYSHC